MRHGEKVMQQKSERMQPSILSSQEYLDSGAVRGLWGSCSLRFLNIVKAPTSSGRGTELLQDFLLWVTREHHCTTIYEMKVLSCPQGDTGDVRTSIFHALSSENTPHWSLQS